MALSRVPICFAAVFVIAICALSLSSAAAAEEVSSVLTLDASNFSDTVAKHPFIVVEFYAPWCGHCKKLAPEYEKAASALSKHDPPVVLAKVDANEGQNKEIASKYEVKGYPTLKILRNGGENIQDYKGPREADGIIEYLKKQVGPASAEIKSAEDASNLISEQKVFIVGIFPEFSGEEFENFIAVAEKLRSEYDFRHTLDAKLLPRGESNINLPIVRLLKPFDELFVDSKDFDLVALEDFIQSSSVPIITTFKITTASRSPSPPAAMVLEATMICIDNSEWMRNGDYSPTRFQAQADAVNLICGAKTQSNPENTVGVLTMAGKGVRVLATPTSDLGKILSCMHGLEIGGELNMTSGIQVAQLALKHRQNKNQQQRIIIFAGSPIKYDKKALEAIGKKLKKNSVALDIVDFGETDDDKPEKLEALLSAVNNNNSSHIVHAPAGPNALSDVLISTPIFTGDGEGGSGFAASAAAAAAVGMPGFDFGVDPNLDPELALALRVSMEEERARQEAAAKKASDDASKQGKGSEEGSSSHDATMAEAGSNMTLAGDDKSQNPMDDAALLEQALALSKAGGATGSDIDMTDASAEDQELALALQMSIEETAKDATQSDATQSGMSKVLEDQSFVSSILNSLPGVDPNDPSVRDFLSSLQGQSEPQEKPSEEKPNEEKPEKEGDN